MTYDRKPVIAKSIFSSNLVFLQKQRLHEILNPIHTGLLVIDLQNDFVSPAGKSSALWHQDIRTMQAILPKIEAVTDLFYEKNRPIIRTITYENPELRTQAGRDRFLWFESNEREKHVACLRGSWGAKLYKPAHKNDIIIEKQRTSAYVETALSKVIAEKNIKTLVVVGVKTQRCVARTVQDLYDNESQLHVVVLEDCVGSDDIALHNATITELKSFYPPVITSSCLKKVWHNYLDSHAS